MIVVGDTSPLNYLLLIGEVDILPSLFSSVLIPQAVASELASVHAPEIVRAWIERPQAWLNIQPDPPPDAILAPLDAGERAAIALALSIGAPQILMDDSDGRYQAEKLGLSVVGTLGVVIEAHRRGLLDFESALVKLARTSFYLSPRLIDRIRKLL